MNFDSLMEGLKQTVHKVSETATSVSDSVRTLSNARTQAQIAVGNGNQAVAQARFQAQSAQAPQFKTVPAYNASLESGGMMASPTVLLALAAVVGYYLLRKA